MYKSNCPFGMRTSCLPSLLVHLLGLCQLFKDFFVVAKDHGCFEHPLKLLDHLVTSDPSSMVSSKPAVGSVVFVHVCHMILVRSRDKSTIFGHIDLHDAKARSVTRRMVESNALIDFEMSIGERLPVEPFEIEVMRKIDPVICFCCHGPSTVLEFFLVNINGYIGVKEVFEATSVIKMKMTKDYSLDVFDIVSGSFDCIR